MQNNWDIKFDTENMTLEELKVARKTVIELKSSYVGNKKAMFHLQHVLGSINDRILTIMISNRKSF